MPLFVSDEEFSGHLDDAVWVAEKADAFIRNLYTELDTVKAQSDAASITAEQTCSLLEQKYLSLSDEHSNLESELAQLKSSFDERLAELAQVQAQKYQLNLKSINKDSEIEMLKTEVSELHKSKRQLMEIVEHKDEDISAKNVTIKSYLDKIVKLSENAAQREARLSEAEADLARAKDSCTHLSQEKELIERHNVWLNDELSAKVDSLIKLRREHADLEADLSFKLANVERKFNDCSTSLNRNKERVRELEAKLIALQEELCSLKNAAATNEERSNAEISTINKLVELYKESSEEWSKKAGELEGVIKALETHLRQVENDYKERLEREISSKNQFEKEAADLKAKLEKCEAEIESSRKANEFNLVPLNNSSKEMWLNSLESADMVDVNRVIVPKIPIGVSGTALAASLLRDGWSLAKMYAKYQEAVDALHHEQLGRKESEAILQRVLFELEEKAEVIMDERVEHERIAESYSMINQKLQDSVSEQEYLERMIAELKADVRRHERDYAFAQKEVADLQREVTILLKECRDIQLRGASSGPDSHDNAVMVHSESDAERVISEHLLTFKDINGLVQQNAQLRSLVRNLSDQLENNEKEFKEKFEMELKKHTDEAASRVEAVLQRAEEQGQMIESLHTSVAMYKRLYEEEHKTHLFSTHLVEAAPEERRPDIRHLLESSQEASRKAQRNAAERVKCLEEDLAKTRTDLISLRSERDKFQSEANIAREKLESFKREFEHQRNELNNTLARNIEFTQYIVDYQRKLREASESVRTAEELSSSMSVEVSLLKKEKELLQHAETRASKEVCSLSERVYRLQASLDTIQSTQQVREEARAAERRKQEEYTEQKEREWADARRELQEEKNNALTLARDRDQTIKNAIKQVEEMRKELSDALHAAASAESRAAVAEARLSELGKKSSSSDVQVGEVDGGNESASLIGNEAMLALHAADEIRNLKDEMQANKDHMLQYKSIAQVNEESLKQMEFAHENFKIEAEKLKRSQDAELLALRERVSELENEITLKSQEVASAAAGNEEALSSALAEISSLKEDTSAKTSQIAALEIQFSTLKEDLEKEHQRWRAAQANYERQVILQSETIQELTKTSQALSTLQEEASELRKLAESLKSENDELKSKWDVEKATLEASTSIAEKNCNEINEQNKILHSQLEALHIQLAERDRGSSGTTSGSSGAESSGDAGLQTVISYLRRTKEIAETEISLLKQEKLRLQSQLESAIKASETAQASLRAERASSRSMLFSEEELKSLQLQVREINLLRESNIQLREENKHNFEECQKLHDISQKASVERHNLERLLRDRQIEVEECRKEIEMLKGEKINLEKRLSELLERYRHIDVDDYDRMKAEHQQLQVTLKEKDSHTEEVKKLLSDKLEIVSSLEQDLANCRIELTERDKKINDMAQVEASLRSEVMEKQKRMNLSYKRKYETFIKEKEDLQRQKDDIQRQKDDIQRQKDDLQRQYDDLSRQLEESKQAKRSSGDTQEKDHKIQTLQKMMDKLREDLKNEKARGQKNENDKAKRQKTEHALLNSINKMEQDKTMFKSELEKHKQAVRQLFAEQEKLKHAKESLPEGTLVVQHLSGAVLDDRASAYILGCENYEKEALSILNDLGAGSAPADTPVADVLLVATSAPAQVATPASSTTPVAILRSKAEESERRPTFPIRNVEPRKPGRRLVRPRLVRTEEPQGDVEMSEMEAAHTQATSTQPLLRKRQASSSQVESNEEVINQGETGLDMAAPVSKKPKGSESPMRSEGKTSTLLENLGNAPASEEPPNADFQQGSTEEGHVDAEKEEIVNIMEKGDDPVEQQFDGSSQPELQHDKHSGLDEDVDGLDVKEIVTEDESKENQVEPDNLQSGELGGDREEGELLPDVSDFEGGDTTLGSPGMEEGLPELDSTPMASPSRVDDEDLAAASVVDTSEVNSPEVDVPEETTEGSDKSNDGIDQTAMETDLVTEAASLSGDASVIGDTSTSTITEASGSKEATASTGVAADVEDTRQVSPTPNIISISETARRNAQLRQRGRGAAVQPTTPNRGRGGRVRPPQRGRGGVLRPPRGRGRGSTSGDQA